MRTTLPMLARLFKPAQRFVRPNDPDYVELAGSERIVIQRDDRGVRSVRSLNEADLFLGFGYCQGRDRFFQIDLFRRLATGRIAELLGDEHLPPAAGVLSRFNFVELDAFMRAVGTPAGAARAYDRLDDESRALIDAFAAGVNLALDRMEGALPPEYVLLPGPEPWNPRDSLAIGTFFGLSVDMGGLAIELELDDIVSAIGAEAAADLYPNGGLEHFVEAPAELSGPRGGTEKVDPERAMVSSPRGSNAWAVDGRWTRTGAPMLCNDPHVPLSPIPGFWYPIVLRAESGIRAHGSSFVGFPVIAFGHNERTAWGLTNVMRDAWDVVRFVQHPGDPDLYRDGDRWRPFDVRLERIGKRFGPPAQLRIRSCDRGVLLPNKVSAEGLGLGYRTVGSDPGAMFRGYTALMRAANWEEHREGLRGIHEGSAAWNSLYADADGRIAWKMVGQIPLRREVATVAPQAGWIDAGDWIGTVPFEEMPELVDPEDGILVTANNQRSDPPFYVSAYYEPQHRARRIRELIEQAGEGGIDVETMRRIQLDVAAPDLRPELDGLLCGLKEGKALAAEIGADPDVDAAIDLLESWDLHFDRRSAAAAIFTAFRDAWARELFAPLLGGGLARRWRETRPGIEALNRCLADPTDRWIERARSATGRSREAMIRTAFLSTLAILREELGSDPSSWALGDILRVELRHGMSTIPGLGAAFNIGDVPAGGSDITVHAAFTCPGGGRVDRVSTAGPSSRMVVDLNDTDGAYFAHSTGTSGDPASRHYADQTRLWLEGRLYRERLPRG
ncbi:MAG: hypothetical protein CME06_07535 [Gemmatimonadetes bacterium]|nr:hypothetical protein [Gemmatimonadota bacterium]